MVPIDATDVTITLFSGASHSVVGVEKGCHRGQRLLPVLPIRQEVIAFQTDEFGCRADLSQGCLVIPGGVKIAKCPEEPIVARI